MIEGHAISITSLAMCILLLWGFCDSGQLVLLVGTGALVTLALFAWPRKAGNGGPKA